MGSNLFFFLRPKRGYPEGVEIKDVRPSVPPSFRRSVRLSVGRIVVCSLAGLKIGSRRGEFDYEPNEDCEIVNIAWR